MYMYCKSITSGKDYVAYALGSNSSTGASYNVCSGGYKYRFVSGDKRFMYNYVNEGGFRYAAIRATGGFTGYANGLWSPDSVADSGVKPASDYIK